MLNADAVAVPCSKCGCAIIRRCRCDVACDRHLPVPSRPLTIRQQRELDERRNPTHGGVFS